MRHGLRAAIAIAIAVLSARNAEAQMTPQFALGLQGGGEYGDRQIGPDFAGRVGARMLWQHAALTFDLFVNTSLYLPSKDPNVPGPSEQSLVTFAGGLRGEFFVTDRASIWMGLHAGGFWFTQSGSSCGSENYCDSAAGTALLFSSGISWWVVDRVLGLGPFVDLRIYAPGVGQLAAAGFGLDITVAVPQ